jgi:uncharacterized protein
MTSQMRQLDLLDLDIGKRHLVPIPITITLAGNALSLPVHVVRGREEGPVLALLSAIHGDEWFGIEFLRRIVVEQDVETLRGTIIAVPVGNPLAFEIGERTAPDESGGTDLNRAFPGGGQLTTSMLASAIAREVLSQADAVLDFHMGDWGVAWASVAYPADLPDQKLSIRARDLAVSFGFPCINQSQLITGRIGTSSAVGYASGVLGVPSAVISIGGPGFGEALETSWVEQGVGGIRNVLKHLRMVDGSPDEPGRMLFFERSWDIRPTVGGMLVPAIGVERLLDEVSAGELLGRVVSPLTFEVIEELYAPCNGYLYSVARQYPVQPGNFAFIAADLTHASTVWDPTDEE